MQRCPFCRRAAWHLQSRCAYCGARLTALDRYHAWRALRRTLDHAARPGRGLLVGLAILAIVGVTLVAYLGPTRWDPCGQANALVASAGRLWCAMGVSL